MIPTKFNSLELTAVLGKSVLYIFSVYDDKVNDLLWILMNTGPEILMLLHIT